MWASGQRGIYKVPSEYWWITTDTPDEDIEKALSGEQFNRVMRDATMELYMTGCDGPFRKGQPYRPSWRTHLGEHVRCEHIDPPPSGWWVRWIPIEDLREVMTSIVSNDGHVLHRVESQP
jgi:hypothetical protein